MLQRFVTLHRRSAATYVPRPVLRAALSLPWILWCTGATSQTSPSIPNPATPPPAASQSTPKIQPITTTVVVEGHVADDYLPTDLSVGGLDDTPLLKVPVSATVVTRDMLTDQFSRVLSDVVKNDASIGEDYAPVGYYGDFQIRGFTIDLATGLEVNGMTIAGEQDVPLENKERVEFLKGIAGVESGVTTAGGLINYVTKRPALVKTLDLATDHRGTAFGGFDLGQLFGRNKQFGIRANLAGESIQSYVESANGWRALGTASTDWKLSQAATLQTDFEYQHKVERSEAGYQVLGGTTVPSLNDVFPSVMLGDQPWSKPNTFDAFNAGSRLSYILGRNWNATVEGSYSHSLIDDNVIWPYGAALDSSGNTACPNAPTAPAYFFCPDGSYEIYDYRSPRELRTDAVGQAFAKGTIKSGPISHDIVAGGSLFHRSVDLSPTIAYAPLGVENIFEPDISYTPESPYIRPGPSTLADFNHQTSGIVQDRVHLPGGVQLLAGGRYASVGDFNYANPRSLWLPQYAITYAPISLLTLYANYGVLLSLGPEAPWWVDNANLFLDPFLTRQAEIGAKFEPGHRILLTAALFRMRQPFFYPKLIQTADAFCTQNVNPGDLCFESDGRETHDGIELGAQGKAASWLRLSATAAGILATSDDSGTSAYNGKQVINVPRVRVATFADVALPNSLAGRLHLSGFHVLPGWGYTGRKEATRDDAVSVAGYNLFNLGARYTPAGEQGRVSFRIFADNILNKRYWKDTGASYGDTFIHLGAPATVRLSAKYTF